tara:strand:- start:516 stop:680 length:165 start_codon:yes stop_codon:yes gene_type:complete
MVASHWAGTISKTISKTEKLRKFTDGGEVSRLSSRILFLEIDVATHWPSSGNDI